MMSSLISDSAVIRATLQNLEASGVFTDVLRMCRLKSRAEQFSPRPTPTANANSPLDPPVSMVLIKPPHLLPPRPLRPMHLLFPSPPPVPPRNFTIAGLMVSLFPPLIPARIARTPTTAIATTLLSATCLAVRIPCPRANLRHPPRRPLRSNRKEDA
jgi:hypothetical protein